MFRKIFVAALFVMVLWSAQAMAGPEGTYRVEGTNPGSGAPYSGTAHVERNGDTYSVVWNVGGTEYIGTGLGAADVKGTPTMGPANSRDTAIAVSYISDGSYGLAFYVEQENGNWKGIWAYGGSAKIGTEVWIRQ